MTIVKRCSCNNKFQDKRFGKGKRLFNTTTSNAHAYRCTVCGKERQ